MVREIGDGLRFLPYLAFVNIENNDLTRIPLELVLSIARACS